MSEKTDYPKIRQLTRADRKRLSNLIKEFAFKSGNVKLTEMIPGKESEEGEEKKTDEIFDLIKSVMQGLLEWLEDDVAEWFMELIGVTDRNEYDNLPFDIELNILEQMYKQNGFKNFFSKALDLYKKIQG